MSDRDPNPGEHEVPFIVPEGSIQLSFHFDGAIAEELRMIQIVEDLPDAELIRVSIENYSIYKALTAQNRMVVVRGAEDVYAEIFRATLEFPELQFQSPREDTEDVNPLDFSVIFTPDFLDQVEQDAAKYDQDIDAYIASALEFERIVARIRTVDFPVMALDSPTSRSGVDLHFA